MIRTPQDFAKFLESLKVKNEGTEEMNGWRFDEKLWPFDKTMFYDSNGEGYSGKAIEYLVERCRRAELNAKPSDIVEKVKSAVRAGMDMSEKCADNSCPCPIDLEGTCHALEFRKLCEEAKP